jgi:hypothetical protein
MGIRTRLLFNPPILHPTAIIRSSVICDGDFYDRTMPQAQDFELWSRLSREHRLGNISDICLLYRKAAGAISERLRGEQQARADAIRVANLIERCGSAFGERHMASHIEMMARRFEAPTPAEHMPGYVRDLLDQPGLSRAVIERTWLSYCIDYSRAGGDGAALLAASGVRADLVDHSMLLIAKRLPSRRTIS